MHASISPLLLYDVLSIEALVKEKRWDTCMCWSAWFRLFDDGVISWGRVVTLLCFGYRMAMVVIRRGLVSFFSNVVRFIVRFVLIEKIAKWIADQGGWVIISASSSTLCRLVIKTLNHQFCHVHSFIHSGYLYSDSSSPWTTTQRRFRHSRDTVPEFHAEAPHATVSGGLAQGP